MWRRVGYASGYPEAYCARATIQAALKRKASVRSATLGLATATQCQICRGAPFSHYSPIQLDGTPDIPPQPSD